MPKSSTPPLDPCPFIDDEDPRCASHFTLGHLSEAFGHCVDGYRGCATYWRLVRDNPQRMIKLTAVTHDGRPLQPTGS